MATIDHLVYGTPDLEAAIDELEQRLGVRAVMGGQHPGVGTHNALLGLGGRTYLEIIGPDPSQADPPNPRPFGLDGLTSSRLVGWAVACEHIDAAVAAARAGGYDPGDAVELTRMTPWGETLHWRLTLNARAGGPIPFLIDWGTSPHPSTTAPSGVTLELFAIQSVDPHAVGRAVAALGADVPVELAAEDRLVARLAVEAGATKL